MKEIAKGAEPGSLIQHRKTKAASYDNYADKDTLRSALVGEQGGLCCYCMGRVFHEAGGMKIEHWLSQRHHPEAQLDYRNLLAACRGGEGQPAKLQHCDTSKGDADLLYNPADPAHHVETRIRYEPDGSIRAEETIFDEQLDSVLNLNLPLLKSQRRGVYDAVLFWWRTERSKGRGRPPQVRIEKELARYDAAHPRAPFSPVASWLLRQRLDAMNR